MTLSGDEWTTLVLRVALVGLLYGAVGLVARIALGELAALAEARVKPERDDGLQLVVLDGPGIVAGKSWPLLPLTTIGRTPNNTVSIDDPYLSGEHAEIARESGAWWVRDKGSTNGTRLNGVPVGGPTAIRAGDIVQFGGIRLQLVAGVDARG